ncbi:MAG: hypothetical protein PUB96_05035 [Helicobacteraceae bacterium]|nr:hypothetical protein [Helicobacteraceae bacterium]
MKNKTLFYIASGFALFIFLVGCIKNAELLPQNSVYTEINNNEDELIAKGFNALDLQNYEEALEFFTKSYEAYKDSSYLREILGILILQNKLQDAKQMAYDFLNKNPKDAEVRSALVGILTNLKDYKAALKESKLLIKQQKSAKNYELLASVYFLKQDYKNAAINLKIAYDYEQDEFILDKLVATHLLFLKDTNTAIKLYENHIKNNGQSKLVGEKLGVIYLELKSYKKAAKVYEALFLEFGEQNYAKSALEIYFKTKDLESAKAFLQKNPKIDGQESILFEIYRLQKDYENSIKWANILYEKNKDINLLAFSAMMRYESAKNPTKALLSGIEADLIECAKATNDALYWNYLGYLMIDHDFNDLKRVEKGLEYVKKALEKEPENHYYLDSLAWGYYKLKDCKSAKEIFDKIPQDEVNKEAELKTHYKNISQCIK